MVAWQSLFHCAVIAQGKITMESDEANPYATKMRPHIWISVRSHIMKLNFLVAICRLKASWLDGFHGGVVAVHGFAADFLVSPDLIVVSFVLLYAGIDQGAIRFCRWRFDSLEALCR